VGTPRRALGCLVLFFAGGCNGDPDLVGSNGVEVWAGRVADSDIVVAAVASEGDATLFFCGGPSSLQEGTHWFPSLGGLDGEVTVDDGDFHVAASASEDALDGAVEAGTSKASFFAPRAGDGTLTGLYEAFGACGHIGLIVLQDDARAAPEAQGACLRIVDGKPEVEQVNPVLPLARDAGLGIAVTVASDPAEEFTVHPLVPKAR
jgi:hypothetical protein